MDINNIKGPVSTNMVEVSTLSTFSSPSVLTPTLTLKLHVTGKKGTKDFRCLYDPASQTSFITQEACDRLKYVVIDNNVTVRVKPKSMSQR